MKKLIHLLLVFSAIALSPSTAVASTKDGSATQLSPGDLLQKHEVSLQVSNFGEGSVTIPNSTSGALEITTNDEIIQFELDSSKKVSSQYLSSSGKIFKNTHNDSDLIALQKSDREIETFHVIKSKNSPTSFTYNLVSSQLTLESVDDKSIVIRDADNTIVGFIVAPWVEDAHRKQVPYSLSVDGSKVIFNINHSTTYTYPILADPTIYGYTVSQAEWNVCWWRLWTCKLAFDASSQAGSAANTVSSRYGWSIHNGGADAFRHCYWSALMTVRLGWNLSYDVGTAHEDGAVGQPTTERNMDLHNNSWGRNYGSYAVGQLSSSSREGWVYNNCINGVINGTLRRLVW